MNNFIADKTIEMNIFEKKLLLKNDSISKGLKLHKCIEKYYENIPKTTKKTINQLEWVPKYRQTHQASWLR